jgi:hypothetical protein
MIIIASNWPQGQLDKPEVLGRLLDYLLIRLITVFDPASCRVFFLGLSRCFRLMKTCRFAMARIIAKIIEPKPHEGVQKSG